MSARCCPHLILSLKLYQTDRATFVLWILLRSLDTSLQFLTFEVFAFQTILCWRHEDIKHSDIILVFIVILRIISSCLSKQLPHRIVVSWCIFLLPLKILPSYIVKHKSQNSHNSKRCNQYDKTILIRCLNIEFILHLYSNFLRWWILHWFIQHCFLFFLCHVFWLEYVEVESVVFLSEGFHTHYYFTVCVILSSFYTDIVRWKISATWWRQQ